MTARTASTCVLLLLVVATSCADTPSTPRTGHTTTRTAERLTISCTADGRTELSTTEAVAEADGVHVHVENRAGEPASLNGLGRDVDPGPSDIVVTTPPGAVDLACWPFSGHGGPEPPTVRLEIVDPNSYFRDDELRCGGGMAWGLIRDFFVGAKGATGTPVDIVRERVRGLRPGDEILTVGYPERQDGSSVAVVRDGSTIAVASFMRADDGGWLLAGGEGCDDADIRF